MKRKRPVPPASMRGGVTGFSGGAPVPALFLPKSFAEQNFTLGSNCGRARDWRGLATALAGARKREGAEPRKARFFAGQKMRPYRI
jgi:hypothetical protein